MEQVLEERIQKYGPLSKDICLSDKLIDDLGKYRVTGPQHGKCATYKRD